MYVLKSVSEVYLYLVNNKDLANLKYTLEIQSNKKIVYEREIEHMVVISEIDKLAILEKLFIENLTCINKNLSKFVEANLKIKKMKKKQKTLINNIEDCLKITSN